MKSTLLGLLVWLISLQVFAFGGFSGNGADYARDQNNPWFLGTAPVFYCLRFSPTYKLSAAESRAVVEEAIAEWRGFFKKYGFDQNTIGDRRYSRRFPDGVSRAIALDFREASDCANNSAELEIMFGLKNDLIKASIEHGGHHGAGLAVRSQIDVKSYRSHGFLWIDNFSDDRARVKHMFLHEFGHVLGMKHDSVHVMDENIADWVFNPKYEKRFIGKIESDYWKYSLASGETMQFYLSPRSLIQSSDPDGYVAATKIDPALREILGITASGEYQVRLVFGRYSEAPMNKFFLKLELIPRSGNASRSLQMMMDLATDQRASQWVTGYYTKWLNADGNAEFIEQLFEPTDLLRARARRLNGVITSASFRSMGCILDFEKGLSLRIFDPTHGKWWELK
jgi:hypothetical protein